MQSTATRPSGQCLGEFPDIPDKSCQPRFTPMPGVDVQPDYATVRTCHYGYVGRGVHTAPPRIQYTRGRGSILQPVLRAWVLAWRSTVPLPTGATTRCIE